MKKLISRLLRENLQLADKIYFNTGKLSAEEKQVILNITNGDNTTKLITDMYCYIKEHQFSDEVKSLPDIRQQILSYNKNLFPIENFDVYNKNNNLTPKLFLDRGRILKDIKTLPSIAIRNMKAEISTPRNGAGFSDYEHHLTYFLAQYSMLNNRSEKFRQSIEKKMFKANITLSDLIDFADEKENMLGGAKVTKNMIKTTVKENSYDLEIVYENGNIMVVDVTTPEGIKSIGCNSLWCFTYGSGFESAYRQWNNYSTNDHVYVIIDFSKQSDDTEFMHVVISPIEVQDDDDENFEQTSVFNMANEPIYNAEGYINHTLGDAAIRILTFGEEPEPIPQAKPRPVVDPNQMSLFERKQLIRKTLQEEIKTHN